MVSYLVDVASVQAEGILWEQEDGRGMYSFLLRPSNVTRNSNDTPLLEITFMEGQAEQRDTNIRSNIVPSRADLRGLQRRTHSAWLKVISNLKGNVIGLEELANSLARNLATFPNQKDVVHIFSVNVVSIYDN